MTTRIAQLFPLWAIGFSIAAYLFPAPFAGLKSAIIPLLALVMFGMGMTLTWHHFKRPAALPGAMFSIWHNLSGSLLATIWGRARGPIGK